VKQKTIELANRSVDAGRPIQRDGPHGARAVAPYRAPLLARSLTELAITVVPFVALWLLLLLSLRYSYWLCLLLAVPTAGFLVRLFMIQHDCGHGSFFRRRRANDWLGRVLGVLTLTPYGYWRHTHAMHHATSGHLGRRGTGDVGTLTVREYRPSKTALFWASATARRRPERREASSGRPTPSVYPDTGAILRPG
jgi:fatty acid desaturase